MKDCYAALGSIHATWKPVQGRFKDYIAMPKFNLYQSLHTTVVGPQGKPLEVQIRTCEMHQRAEFGVAAHWSYKDDTRPPPTWRGSTASSTGSRRRSDPDEFMENLKIDLEQDEVFVFTPKGGSSRCPPGRRRSTSPTPIHTEVGHACIGARVNGRLVPLDSELQSGDTVRDLHLEGRGRGPVTRLAEDRRARPGPRNKIRQWFSRERREDAIETGREELMKAHAPRGPAGAEARSSARCSTNVGRGA